MAIHKVKCARQLFPKINQPARLIYYSTMDVDNNDILLHTQTTPGRFFPATMGGTVPMEMQ